MSILAAVPGGSLLEETDRNTDAGRLGRHLLSSYITALLNRNVKSGMMNPASNCSALVVVSARLTFAFQGLSLGRLSTLAA